MDSRRLLLLVGAVIVAVMTALAARVLLGAGLSAQAGAPVRVLVAEHALATGTVLTADAVSFHAWPREAVHDAYFIDGNTDLARLVGTVVRQPVSAGEPLTRGAVVAPGDRGFLAATLAPGMRAVTIPVSAPSGVGGFVFPGDHVDLVLTQSVDRNGGANLGGGAVGSETGLPGASGGLRVSETIIRNLRVLATDQSANPATQDGRTQVHPLTSVTVEVTPRLAEKIAVAETIGSLSLSLRALARDSTSGALARDLTSGALARNAASDPDATGGPVDADPSFVTGGDVSRFQPRGTPEALAASLAAHAGSALRGAMPGPSPWVRPAAGGAGPVVPPVPDALPAIAGGSDAGSADPAAALRRPATLRHGGATAPRAVVHVVRGKDASDVPVDSVSEGN